MIQDSYHDGRGGRGGRGGRDGHGDRENFRIQEPERSLRER